MASPGGRTLAFNVYPYEDHSRLVVTLRHSKPVLGRDLVLGSIRLDIGREDLAGLASHVAVRLVAVSILNALSDSSATETGPVAPGSPSGDMGEQLTLDLALRV